MARNQAKKMNQLRTSQVLFQHAGAVTGNVLLQIIVRVFALLPLLVLFKGVQIPVLGDFAPVFLAALSAVLYLFVVMPVRYMGYGKVSQWTLGSNGPKEGYVTCILASLRRVLVGWLWGLPFLFAAGMFVYAYNGMSLTAFFKILTTLGGLIGGGFDDGIIIWVAGIVIFGLLFAWGWWRNTPKDYVPLDQGVKAAWKAGALIRRKHLGAYWLSALVNMLLTLPSIVLIIAAVGMNYVGGVSFAGGAMMAAQQLMMKLASPLSSSTMLYLCAILFFVHLPLCVVRKTRMAVLTCRLFKQHFDQQA